MSAPPVSSEGKPRTVSMVTLGCSRNEVDSEELAGRLSAAGWEFSDEKPDVVLVNTCGFIEQAKQDSIDTLMDAGDSGAKVVAVGCMAERYGNQLADSLPEADAVLSFDDYSSIDDRLNAILAGEKLTAHTPRDRRALLPIAPVDRHKTELAIPGHGDAQEDAELARRTPASGPSVLRRRLDNSPVAPLKLASGCDRRCTFCAIPSFRGAFVSRKPDDVLAEAQWLADHGVRELFLVSENSTSYGKDLGNPQLLEQLLPALAQVEGIDRVRVSYLQPAEMRPSLIKAIATTPGVAPYFDLSFQHASTSVLRRMRRFGGTDSFLELLSAVRALAPQAGIRSNFIVGFPGETDEEFAELENFITQAQLDAIGVFSYSDEEGTAAADLPGKLQDDVITQRYERLSNLAEELANQRAADRIGSQVDVLVESVVDSDDGMLVEGRAELHAPEVDGTVALVDWDTAPAIGSLVRATVVDTIGVDLIASLTEQPEQTPTA